ncbi:MAG: 2'-5' RNA ligase family protein [Candidatus ainarchaeum sp.]|nr:2'-5' RNA ligase family protein [Candidatus ainarchaeum sp.]
MIDPHSIIATIIINLPKDKQEELQDQINIIYKKYSKFRLSGSIDGIYKNIPHITIARIEDAQKNLKEIDEVMQNASKCNNFEINIKKLKLLQNESSSHIVFEIEKSKEILELHNKIYSPLQYLISEDWKKFGGENYLPHLTVISGLPQEKANEILKEVKLKPFNFTANIISIKIMELGEKATIYKTYTLKS